MLLVFFVVIDMIVSPFLHFMCKKLRNKGAKRILAPYPSRQEQENDVILKSDKSEHLHTALAYEPLK